VSWNNTQIVATVASNAASGSAQVQQGGAWSNGQTFTVPTANITTVSPASGVAGTFVTLTGTGFGATQGTGQVWLGTLPAVVQGWSNTQIVAQVAAGSDTGYARVLQNGVMSNAPSFTVNSLKLTGVSPGSGSAGTSVTLSGTGFGATQGSGTVTLGSIAGQVVSWSDTQVVATVATGSLSGIARVQQGGVLSNALSFIVPPSGGGTVSKLVPTVSNMVVGETRTLQALNSSGQTVTGLTWTSSDSTIVSLSTDNPPVLSALAAGHVTITAGSATADVTVYATALPLGTTIWSNPGNGSGVSSIVPAVPSATGVADVFAFQNDGTVQAITSDGTVAWTADASNAVATPDFQGGLVLASYDGSKIVKLDGLTGQPYPAFTFPVSGYPKPVVVHTDGTIFTFGTTAATAVMGIDPITGTQKFGVPRANSGANGSAGGLFVAGDGYAYTQYERIDGCGDNCVNHHVYLLRVNSVGASDDIHIMDWQGKVHDCPRYLRDARRDDYQCGHGNRLHAADR
jgi:hypothetical protein